MTKNDQIKAAVCAVLLLLFLAGCASYTDLAAGTSTQIEASPVVSSEQVNVAPFVATEIPEADYRVGPGDILYVNVQGVPEMGSPVMASASKIQGNRIDGVGNIHLPLVGSVNVAGLTLAGVETMY